MTTGLYRNDKDKFYTSINIAKKCIDLFNNIVNPDVKNDLFIEPSAGSGSFSKIMNKKYKNNLFLDIDPHSKSKNIIKKDFLTVNEIKFTNKNFKIHVIGNPPFGRQSKLAKKFIKKASVFADTIAFILPKSFKKESYKSVFPLNFHLIKQINIPKNSYIIKNEPYDVNTIFQIWVKKNINRHVKKSAKEVGYKFIKKDENPDFCIRRIGFYASKAYSVCKDKSTESHYFIKLINKKYKTKFINMLNELKIKSIYNTVGPRSISKSELIPIMNCIYEKICK